MRISNLQFAKGSIIYARFPEDMDFLNSRPLVVISDHIPLYDCVWVVKCGTQGKGGINVSLYNYATKNFIGGQEITTIYPSSIYTVKVSQIISTIGILDRRIMKKLDDAIDFFLGRTDEVPEFLSGFKDELTSVIYQPALSPYTQVNECVGTEYQQQYSASIYPVQLPSGSNTWNLPIGQVNQGTKDANDKESYVGPKPKKNGSKSVPKKTSTYKRSGDISEDKIAEFLTLQCKFEEGESASVRALTDSYNKWANTTTTSILFSRVMNQYLKRINSSVKRSKVKGSMVFEGIRLISEDINGNDPNTDPKLEYDLFNIRDSEAVRAWASNNRSKLPDISNIQPGKFLYMLGEESATIIVTRQASIGAIRIKYLMSEEEAENLRNTIQGAVQTVGSNLISKIMRGQLAEHDLTEFEKVCVVIACKLFGFGNSPKVRVKLNHIIQTTMRKHNIDFSEKTVWGDAIYK